MWRFLNNVEPPKKKSKSAEEKRAAGKEYDQTKRQRSFQNSWLAHPNFKLWLRYDKETALMFCNICEQWATSTGQAMGKTEFVKGCSSLRIESLHKHAKSETHTGAVAAKGAAEAPPGTSTADKLLRQMNQTVINRLEVMFRTCHFLAKKARPFADFVEQCDLDEAKGVDVGQTYRTEPKCREFTDAISEIQRQNLEKEISDSKFFSVMCDEATDAAVVEQIILFVSNYGKVTTRFLSIQKLERATAANCYGEIIAALHEYCGIQEPELWSKLVGFGSDGASVMTGRRSGVGARMKEHQPKLQTVHCIAHRLELAIKQASKNVPMVCKMDQFLINIFLFYHNSTLNRGLLRRTAEALGVTRFIPTRTGGTRWIGHTQNALTNLLSGYPAIVQHLLEIKEHNQTSNDSKGKSAGFLKLLLSRPFLGFLHFMVDVTNILGRLSRTFQRMDMNLPEMPKLVKDTVTSLDKLKSHITEAINIRFDIDAIQLAAAKVINFKSWPIEAERDFGDAEIAELVDYFSPVLEKAGTNTNSIEMEWSSVKESAYTDYKPVYNASWEQLGVKYRVDAENLFSLVDLILTIPAHSVECERGFSQMKRVKTDWRNQLTSTALTSTLRILMEGPSIKEFVPELLQRVEINYLGTLLGKDKVLRDRFVEVLVSHCLKTNLRKELRKNAGLTFPQIRDEALQIEGEMGAEMNATNVDVIRATNQQVQGQPSELQKWQQTMEAAFLTMQKQMSELQATLTQPRSWQNRGTTYGPRPTDRFTKPICRICHFPGHIGCVAECYFSHCYYFFPMWSNPSICVGNHVMYMHGH
ncbi:putative zinc finger protein [Apostichopus japonicus]|uniref:Putative zinc finger protein n=1 Tax=Stichopus japonicus TaxID=307972 RepID=A0A2G8KZ15_STIJA|nr:putative zinc finger protein [Apostichopus japonicus]